MPKVKPVKRARKPRQGRRGRGVTGGAAPMASLGSEKLLGVSQTLRRTLCFVNSDFMNISSAGATNQVTFALNNAYRPQVGLAQAAPGFDKYMTFYTKAFVLGATIKVKFVNSTSNVYNLTWVGRFQALHGLVVDTTNPTVVPDPTIAQGLSDFMHTGTGEGRGQFTKSIDVGRFLNKPYVLDDPNLLCTPTAGPSELIYANFWSQQITNDVSCAWTTTILMDVVFTDPQPFT